ncbi:fibroleukin-like isoform X2 [Drosophila busckii]|nr:fibroleukin-like isoform X2 [Drosophila busckii]
MEFFNGTTIYARYDNFTVSDEQDNFRLLSVGEHTGTAEDRLYFHVNRGFTTFDKDNNDWVKVNCAEDRHGAWWYGICSISNLNGKYFDAEVYGYRTSIYWEPWIALKTVKMAIRPFPNKN